jgi:methyltransferase (TIGR00027 family)
MSILSLLVYIPLQILFIPIAIVGGSLVAYKQLVVSKRLGISQTAIEVINGRWTMHIFGMRNDIATARLAAALPNNSLLGMWLFLFPLWLKHRISGKLFMYPRIPEPGLESIADLMIARTLYFDSIIDRQTPQVEQFVIMGAGYDTRAYGNLQREGLTFFEVDQPSVQQHKQEALESAGIDCDQVKFVSVDFAKENIFEKLLDCGFDSTKKTLFLWEGVTLYLSEADVRNTLQQIRDNAASGSVIVADIYANSFMSGFKSGRGNKVMEYTDEGLLFGLDFETNWSDELLRFIESESLAVGETFFMGSSREKGPFVVITEIKL